MLLKKLVQPFVDQRPYCVLVRAALQRMLCPSRLDQVFRDHAVQQYERDLMFSSLVELMAQVVTRIEPSVLASYRTFKKVLGVSDEAVYQKLRNVETTVSEAMVRDSFAVAQGVLHELDARRWTIEVVFLEMQTALCCEVDTLGYPRAALFAFCVA